jgi:uroporphyrinogen-III decarboxylase
VSNEKAVFHLVDRITFGPRLADLEDALALGYDAYLKRQLAPRSIYVFANVHNIQGDVPPENIEALFDAAYEFGFYD